VPKHRCAAGITPRKPAIPYVVTRDGPELYTRGEPSSNFIGLACRRCVSWREGWLTQCDVPLTQTLCVILNAYRLIQICRPVLQTIDNNEEYTQVKEVLE